MNEREGGGGGKLSNFVKGFFSGKKKKINGKMRRDL